ncbi:hypothetical protein C6370_10545 [Bacillus atrophaeus]|nr:hypothetical protein C6370_10545 [Bacillus atrophaeus]
MLSKTSVKNLLFVCRRIPPYNRLNIHYFKINYEGNAKKFCTYPFFAHKLPEIFAGKPRILTKNLILSVWHGTCIYKKGKAA